LIKKGIARRYARALFGLGEKDGKYKKYMEELVNLTTVLNANKSLFRAVMFPLHDIKFRKEILNDLAKGMNISSPVLNLLILLVENERIKYLPYILEDYSKLVDEKENVIRGKIYSPYPLEEEILKEIEGILSEKLKKKVILDVVEDKTLIGGLKLVLNGIVLDGTIRKQLEIMKETILKE